MFEFDVFTALHDDVKTGTYTETRSRVVLSRDAFPDPAFAAETAGVLAASIHGGMPTRILIRL